MNKGLAQVLSYLLHPVIFPIIGVLTILKTLPYFVNSQIILLSMTLVFTGTYILPVLVSFLFYKTGIISSLEMHIAKDRRWPYLVGALFYYLTASTLKSLELPEEAHLFLTASALVILIHLMTFPFFKPSAHLAGIGGFTGLLIALSLRYQIGVLPYLALCFILAGFLGSARLKLGAHTNAELAFGYISGMVIVTITLLFS